jgi:hypothetical protein
VSFLLAGNPFEETFWTSQNNSKRENDFGKKKMKKYDFI